MIAAKAMDREDVRQSMRVIKEVADEVKKGKIFLIFPEGTRSKTGKVGKGKTGVALIAARSGAPVVPAGIIFDGKLKFRTTDNTLYNEIMRNASAKTL